jgi:hypothetical protein
VNDHQIAVRTGDVRIKERIIEELATYQDASKGDGKRMATPKEDVKAILGRSPDLSDTLIMRMFFVIRGKLSPVQSIERGIIKETMRNQFATNERNFINNSTK